jgi:hypothetical protein
VCMIEENELSHSHPKIGVPRSTAVRVEPDALGKIMRPRRLPAIRIKVGPRQPVASLIMETVDAIWRYSLQVASPHQPDAEATTLR